MAHIPKTKYRKGRKYYLVKVANNITLIYNTLNNKRRKNPKIKYWIQNYPTIHALYTTK